MVAQRVSWWRVEVISMLSCSAELADNTELGGSTQRAMWVASAAVA
jgi:hypothetical protein